MKETCFSHFFSIGLLTCCKPYHLHSADNRNKTDHSYFLLNQSKCSKRGFRYGKIQRPIWCQGLSVCLHLPFFCWCVGVILKLVFSMWRQRWLPGALLRVCVTLTAVPIGDKKKKEIEHFLLKASSKSPEDDSDDCEYSGQIWIMTGGESFLHLCTKDGVGMIC